MPCPTLTDLPAPPPGRTGWPWTEAPPPLPATDDGRPWPRISMVTPSYNQAAYIEETIRAVLLQGYPNLEYIISEDGSTDDSLAIIEKYTPWVRLLKAPENSGMSAAINRGFAEADGDIITWIATDDVYQPGAFAEVGRSWNRVNAAEYGVFVGAFRFMDPESVMDEKVHPPQAPHEGPVDLTLEKHWRMHQVSIFYTRHALDAVGRFVREEIRHNMDRELLFRVARSYKVKTTGRVLAAFRRHPRSKSWNPHKMIEMARDFAEVYAYFDDGGEAANARRRRIARNRIAKGYVKFAKYHPHYGPSIGGLLGALRYNPRLVLQGRYLKDCLKVLLKPLRGPERVGA